MFLKFFEEMRCKIAIFVLISFDEIMQAEVLTLTDLQLRLKAAVVNAMPGPCWVKAEIHSLKVNMSGHCYMDLIENDAEGRQFKAKVQAIVWASKWRMLEPYFLEVAGKRLAVGMGVLLKVRVQYSELYGMSLIVEDIDPAFTLGDAEMKRQATIARLKAEGMFDMNRTLGIPRLIHRFAVISAEGAAGYGDFVRHIGDNGYGFRFFHRLYSAPMQGNAAPEGIVAALENVMEDSEAWASYDAVLILRGGGSNADLACFDDYDLAANIAQFPLPVFVAVGHERDVHICDMVAAVSVKTPTALADYILDAFISEDNMLVSFADRLTAALRNRIGTEDVALQSMVRRLFVSLQVRIDGEERALQNMTGRLFSALRSRMDAEGRTLQNITRRVVAASVLRMKGEAAKLDMLELRLEKSDPREILQSGYAMVYKKDVRVPSVASLAPGDDVMVGFQDGKALCRVEKITGLQQK